MQHSQETCCRRPVLFRAARHARRVVLVSSVVRRGNVSDPSVSGKSSPLRLKQLHCMHVGSWEMYYVCTADMHTPARPLGHRAAKHLYHRLSLRCVSDHQTKNRVTQHHFAVANKTKPAIGLCLADRPVDVVDETVSQLPLVPAVRNFVFVVTGTAQVEPQTDILEERTRKKSTVRW